MFWCDKRHTVWVMCIVCKGACVSLFRWKNTCTSTCLLSSISCYSSGNNTQYVCSSTSIGSVMTKINILNRQTHTAQLHSFIISQIIRHRYGVCPMGKNSFAYLINENWFVFLYYLIWRSVAPLMRFRNPAALEKTAKLWCFHQTGFHTSSFSRTHSHHICWRLWHLRRWAAEQDTGSHRHLRGGQMRYLFNCSGSWEVFSY